MRHFRADRTLLCERTREWAALRVDGQLTEPESTLMAAHIDRCAECRAFSADVAAVTEQLRATPLVPVPAPVVISTPRRLSLRHTQVAAAAAIVVAAAGIGGALGALRSQEVRQAADAGVVRSPMVTGLTSADPLLRDIRLASLKPTGPLAIGEAKPVLRITL